MRVVVLAALSLACRSAEPPTAAAHDELSGTFRVGPAPARLIACKPGHGVHVFVDVETSLGTLRFGEGKLRWDGAELACEKLDRRWGGGVRNDGSAYFRGMLDFRCGKLVGQLNLDCGGVSASEGAELEKNARAAGSAQSSGPAEPRP
jgi:hypothetical protein